ncbi:MFS domain-containing protein [Fusarium keratoplasticum]|uniref:MFS domain-containing protein n=1 Tax=Fusarium keratoplasticum TaxID=1328300 RepID=A0ACC0R8X2_9HYPO|nr:MFS domain-containing protein [Fusarium keratoplasticum]KAI8679148.1 MFS domain-containing protein [Fusarium keratoplasticum]
MMKPEVEALENRDAGYGLTEEHKHYLVERHGTVELDPIPSMHDADPLNWPKWKKIMNLSLVSFHAFVATFTASCIQSAFVEIAEDLNQTVQSTSYLVSIQIAVLGGAPLFWRPLSQRYGRRPLFLMACICSLVCNVGCAVSQSYATMALCRALVSFFICPAMAIGTAVVQETFFRKERARFMGIWTLMVTLGVPVAPFICGFVAQRVNYRWIYWILAITNGVQFLLHIFFGPESRFDRAHVPQGMSTFKLEYLSFRRIDHTPLKLIEFVHPLRLVAFPNVMIPAAAYSMIFLFGNIMLTFMIPQIFPEKFGFDTQQVGLQYIGIIVGTLIGEQFGGIMSDKWMWLRERKGKMPQPEYRLWLSYLGHLSTICGVVVFLVQSDNASDKWNVTPIIGAGIAAAGNQIVTTVLITYAVDCYPDDAAAVGVFISLVRQMWGFIGPFWIPNMAREIGLSESAGVAIALIVVVALIPTMVLQWKGRYLQKCNDKTG